MGNAIEIDFKSSKTGDIRIVSEKRTLLKKDGTPKNTKNNTKLCRDTVANIKEEDIPKFIEYFDMRIMCASDSEKRKSWVRNKVMFVCAINIGLRVSDLVKLKWSTVLFKNGKFREGVKIKPDKTSKCNGGKGKLVFLAFNESFQRAVAYYMNENHIIVDDENYNDYMFKTRQSGHMSPDAWGIIVKNAGKACNVTYNVNSHSCRKTFCRSRYDHAEDKNMVLTQLQMLLGHSSTLVTLRYICIEQEEIRELYNSVNLGM